jgi:hypothetical protein
MLHKDREVKLPKEIPTPTTAYMALQDIQLESFSNQAQKCRQNQINSTMFN